MLLNGVTYQDLVGWGWHGYKTEVTFRPPPGVTILYNNVYDPPSPPASQGMAHLHLHIVSRLLSSVAARPCCGLVIV